MLDEFGGEILRGQPFGLVLLQKVLNPFQVILVEKVEYLSDVLLADVNIALFELGDDAGV